MQPFTNDWIYTCIHAHIGIMDTCHMTFRRATLNSAKCFQNYLCMLLKQVSLHLYPEKANTAVETNKNKQTDKNNE